MFLTHDAFRLILPGTYKVRNEIKIKRNETKRNEINESKAKRNETKSTKTNRNQRKQTDMKKMEEKNNRGLKEIQPIFTITMLDYFPHMFIFRQERIGFVHH